MKRKPRDQWIDNQLTSIEEYYFLPQFGFSNPFRKGLAGYTIDGYQNYKPSDISVESIMKQIHLDFETYIVPELLKVHCLDDWNKLKAAKMKRREEKEIRLLLYFSQAHSLSCSPGNRPLLAEYQNSLHLSNDDIRENISLLEVIAQHSRLPELLDRSRNYVSASICGDKAE